MLSALWLFSSPPYRGCVPSIKNSLWMVSPGFYQIYLQSQLLRETFPEHWSIVAAIAAKEGSGEL